MQGEDWQHANVSKAWWDCNTNACDPNGKNDCESSFHSTASKYLKYVEVAGGKGSHIIRDGKEMEECIALAPPPKAQQRSSSSSMGKVLQRVYRDVLMMKDKVVICNIPAEAKHSIKKFAQYALENVKNSKDMLAYAITIKCAIYASDDFQLNTVLGLANGAAVTSTMKQWGGHCYGEVYVFGKPALGEATANVLDRMHTENPAQVKSIVLFAKAFSDVAQKKIEKIIGTESGITIRPLMMSSSIGHTEDFYGVSCISSHVLTYKEALESDKLGGFLFSQKKDGKFTFGTNPEDPIADRCVEVGINSESINSRILKSRAYAASIKNRSCDAAAAAPYTHALRSNIKATRELCGARVPAYQWQVWMDRMYGNVNKVLDDKSIHHNGDDAADIFDAKGKVARVIVTFPDNKAMDMYGPLVASVWNFDSLKSKLDKENIPIHYHAASVLEKEGITKMKFSVDKTLNVMILTATVTEPGKMISKQVWKKEDEGVMVAAAAASSSSYSYSSSSTGYSRHHRY